MWSEDDTVEWSVMPRKSSTRHFDTTGGATGPLQRKTNTSDFRRATEDVPICTNYTWNATKDCA